MIATPGGNRYHQAPAEIAPWSNALSRIGPQEMWNGSPSPRNDSVVSVRIAAATVSVVFANTSGITFGSTYRFICRQWPAPSALARSR